jgi:hypothetical protein
LILFIRKKKEKEGARARERRDKKTRGRRRPRGGGEVLVCWSRKGKEEEMTAEFSRKEGEGSARSKDAILLSVSQFWGGKE